MSNTQKRSYRMLLGAATVLLVLYAFTSLPVAAATQGAAPAEPAAAAPALSGQLLEGVLARSNAPVPSDAARERRLQAQAQDLCLRVVELTNQERAKHGLPALIVDPALTRSAQGHSDDMANNNFFSHTGSNGSDLVQRLTAAGYSPIYAAGENIAAGQVTPEEVVAAWMASDGHRRNILSSYYHHIGVGYAYREGTTYWRYWTQDFGSHGPNPPPPPPPPSPTATPTPRPIPWPAGPHREFLPILRLRAYR